MVNESPYIAWCLSQMVSLDLGPAKILIQQAEFWLFCRLKIENISEPILDKDSPEITICNLRLHPKNPCQESSDPVSGLPEIWDKTPPLDRLGQKRFLFERRRASAPHAALFSAPAKFG